MPIFVHKNNQQLGPYEPKQVLDMLRDGALSPDDMGIEQGGTAWQKLGQIFPGVGVQKPPSATQPAANVVDAPAKSGGGCLKGGLIGLGLLALLLGIIVAAGSRFIPSVSCDLVESDKRKIEKLKSDIERARSKYDRELGSLLIELEAAEAGIRTSQKYCDDDRFRNNMVAGGGGLIAFVGSLMIIIGLFVGRKK